MQQDEALLCESLNHECRAGNRSFGRAYGVRRPASERAPQDKNEEEVPMKSIRLVGLALVPLLAAPPVFAQEAVNDSTPHGVAPTAPPAATLTQRSSAGPWSAAPPC